MRNKLCTTMGVELTYLVKERLGYYVNEKVTNDIRATLEDSLSSKCDHIDRDGHNCIEIASKPMKTIKQFERWYNTVNKKARSLGLRPTYDEFYAQDNYEGYYYGTGGGHIHVGVDLTDKDLVINILRFIAVRPWLSWIFNETCDESNAQAILDLSKEPLIRSFDYFDSSFFHDVFIRYALCSHSFYTPRACTNWLDKNYAVRTSEFGTIEFRFFDAPKNWKQLQEHLLFADAIVRYCKMITNRGVKLPPLKYKSLRHWKRIHKPTPQSVRNMLKDTCSQLDISYMPYLKYVNNMKLRIEEGYKLN